MRWLAALPALATSVHCLGRGEDGVSPIGTLDQLLHSAVPRRDDVCEAFA